MSLTREVHSSDLFLAGGVVVLCLLYHEAIFTLLTALVLMVPVCYLFVFISGLVFGRVGLAAATLFSLFLVTTVVVSVFIK